MFVAAVAASTVAFASCEPPTPGPGPEPVDQAYVYAIKFSVKTTKGVATGTKATQGQGSQCVPGTVIPGSCLVYRTKDSTAFQGWIYDCEPTCGSIATGSIILWDTKRKVELEDAAFSDADNFIHVMGKNDTEAEWLFGITGNSVYEVLEDGTSRAQLWTLTCAGLGKYDTKNDRYASFSGNFAGTATAPYDLKTNKTKYDCACDPAICYECADLLTPLTADTVAYGTWSASYNASASKKLNTQGFLTVPNWLINGKVLSKGKFYPMAN